ncbi:hypothetical protein GCM10009603_12450 [Nocardiopsis exhalans]
MPGRPLSRLEAGVILPMLFERFPDMTLEVHDEDLGAQPLAPGQQPQGTPGPPASAELVEGVRGPLPKPGFRKRPRNRVRVKW